MRHASTSLEVTLPYTYNDGYTVMYMLLNNPQCPLGHLRNGADARFPVQP